jgi:hypothetical protein
VTPRRAKRPQPVRSVRSDQVTATELRGSCRLSGAEQLCIDYGVDAARIARSDTTAEATDDPPVVQLQIGIVKK